MRVIFKHGLHVCAEMIILLNLFLYSDRAVYIRFTILTIILEAIVCQMNKAQENHQVENFSSKKHLPVTD